MASLKTLKFIFLDKMKYKILSSCVKNKPQQPTAVVVINTGQTPGFSLIKSTAFKIS